ncbi:hypothetical protein EDC02_3142 [Micromonospora sp. Llam0]|nr:hypothetical protein EDC02_3142 [Micromonospora sp. Llam0]
MSSTPRDANVDLIAIPRAVVSLAAEVVHTMERAVIGDHRVRTAKGNAWEAICADRARAHQRDEIRRLVATLTAARSVEVPDTADEATATAAAEASTTAEAAATAVTGRRPGRPRSGPRPGPKRSTRPASTG